MKSILVFLYFYSFSVWAQTGLSSTHFNQATEQLQTNITAQYALKVSDPARCYFNSHYDAYKSKTTAEKNAEVVLKAFEYVAGGNGIEDFWKFANNKSIHQNAKDIALQLNQIRKKNALKFEELDRYTKCSCLDIKGPSNYPNEVAWFQSNCPEYQQNYKNENGKMVNTLFTVDGNDNEGASGLRYKALLVDWLQRRVEIMADHATSTQSVSSSLDQISEQINNYNFENYQEIKNIFLYSFADRYRKGFWQTVFNWVNQNVFNGQLLNVLSSFTNDPKIIGFVSGYLNGWAPKLNTEYTGSWDYECVGFTNGNGVWIQWGPNSTCIGYHYKWDYYNIRFDYIYSNICNAYTKDGGCIKSFYTTEINGTPHYIIDPFIPAAAQGSFVMDKDVVGKYNSGFNEGKGMIVNPENAKAIQNRNPNPNLSIILERQIAHVNASGAEHVITQAQINVIKEKAKEYALANNYYLEGDQLDLFANYVYEYHFVFPFASPNFRYPMPGFKTYFAMISYNLGNAFISAANTVAALSSLHQQYYDDYTYTNDNMPRGFHGQNKGKFIVPLKPFKIDLNLVRGILTGKLYYDGGKNGSLPGLETGTGQFLGSLGNFASGLIKKQKELANWEAKVNPQRKDQIGTALVDVTKKFNGPIGATGTGSIVAAIGAAEKHHQKDDKKNVAKAAPAQVEKKKSSSTSNHQNDTYSEDSGDGSNWGRYDKDSKKSAVEEVKKEDLAALKDGLNNENLNPNESDTLFKIVSKAYFRTGYPRLLIGLDSDAQLTKPEAQPVEVEKEEYIPPTPKKKKKTLSEMPRLDM